MIFHYLCNYSIFLLFLSCCFALQQFVGAVSDTEQLDFICALIRDGVESFQTPRLAAMLYFDKPEKARLAVHYIIQKIIDLSLGTQDVTVSKKERDKDLQVYFISNSPERCWSYILCELIVM